MLLITCPHCGPRTETEFGFGGQAGVRYPKDPDARTDEEWARYLFYRTNPRGPHLEQWVHAGGCRKWFTLVRDTRTNTFAGDDDGPRP